MLTCSLVVKFPQQKDFNMNRMTLMVLLGALALGGCTAEENAQLGDLGGRLRAGSAALRDQPP
jgi:hypothetical protein